MRDMYNLITLFAYNVTHVLLFKPTTVCLTVWLGGDRRAGARGKRGGMREKRGREAGEKGREPGGKGAGARGKRGGMREKRGREAGVQRWREPGKIEENFATFRDILQ